MNYKSTLMPPSADPGWVFVPPVWGGTALLAWPVTALTIRGAREMTTQAPTPLSMEHSGQGSSREPKNRCPGCGSWLRNYDSRVRDGFRYRKYKCEECGTRASSAEFMLAERSRASIDQQVKSMTRDEMLRVVLKQIPSVELLNELLQREIGEKE